MSSGRYQVSTGRISNPYEGLTSSLNTLSKTLLDAAHREDVREQAALRDAESDRRYQLELQRTAARDAENDRRYQQGLAQAEADRAEALRRHEQSYGLQKATHDARQEALEAEKGRDNWYRGFSDNYNLDDVRRHNAKAMGYTDQQIASFDDKTLKEIPVGQEDVHAYYAKDFSGKHSGRFDPTRIQHQTSDVSSWAGRQAVRDEQAKKLEKLNEKQIGHAYKVYKEVNGSKKKIRSYSDIDYGSLIKGFSGDSMFLDSDKEKAKALVQHMAEQAKAQNLDPQAAYDGMKIALFNLSEGSNLDEINSDPELAAQYMAEAVEARNKLKEKGLLAGDATKSYNDFVKGYSLIPYVNVRQEAFKKAKGVVDAYLKNKDKPASTAPSSPQAGHTLEDAIMQRLGLSVPTAKVPEPTPTPYRPGVTPDNTPAAQVVERPVEAPKPRVPLELLIPSLSEDDQATLRGISELSPRRAESLRSFVSSVQSADEQNTKAAENLDELLKLLETTAAAEAFDSPTDVLGNPRRTLQNFLLGNPTSLQLASRAQAGNTDLDVLKRLRNFRHVVQAQREAEAAAAVKNQELRQLLDAYSALPSQEIIDIARDNPAGIVAARRAKAMNMPYEDLKERIANYNAYRELLSDTVSPYSRRHLSRGPR